MCGIMGVISDVGAVQHSMDLNTMRHRGPDDQGMRRVVLPWCTADIGATRLSIVDATGTVPTPGFFPTAGVLLAFNGEIYNWRQLRQELSNGSPWMTNCDTEVVAYAWRRWGPGMLSRFNGMFALALVDTLTGSIFLARDRAGEKPLYYSTHNSQFHFASEVKALGLPLQETHCRDVDVLEFDCLETTPFLNVTRLNPGHYLLLNSPDDLHKPSPMTWWSLPTDIDEDLSWELAVDEVEALVVDAVRLRAQSEVPATALVSGGLDSAIVQAVAKFPEVFCCTFPSIPGMDWLPAAQLAAPNAHVIPVTFSLQQALQDLPQIAYHLDTPATWSALPQWFMAQRIHEHNYKVLLSGEGVDELFAGYSRYRILRHLDQARIDPQLTNYQTLVNLVLEEPKAILSKLLDRSLDNVSIDHARTLVERFSTSGDMVANMCRIEWHTTMQCLLRMADRMMAAYSIENRSPFLDYRLIELAARIPTRYKVTSHWSKAVMREVALRLGVSPTIVNNPTKTGLVVPWNQWKRDTEQTSTSTTSDRGIWDRGDFTRSLTEVWRSVYFQTSHGYNTIEATRCRT